MGVTSVNLQVMHSGIRLVVYTDVYQKEKKTPTMSTYSFKGGTLANLINKSR